MTTRQKQIAFVLLIVIQLGLCIAAGAVMGRQWQRGERLLVLVEAGVMLHVLLKSTKATKSNQWRIWWRRVEYCGLIMLGVAALAVVFWPEVNQAYLLIIQIGAQR